MAAQTEIATDAAAATTPTLRTVIVIDRDLPKGLAANAAAVLAHAFGARRPDLVGGDFSDATGATHAGLIPTGLPVLGRPPATSRPCARPPLSATCSSSTSRPPGSRRPTTTSSAPPSRAPTRPS
jgi:hypothetical protein